MQFTNVSVIIPVFNEPSIGATIEAVLVNRPPVPYEVLVVGKSDACRLPEDPAVRFVDTGVPCLPSLSRNRGAGLASGDLLLFTDADCIVDPDWIQKALEVLGQDRRVVGGGVRFPQGNYWNLGDNVAVFHPFHPAQPARVVTEYVGTINLAVARDVFDGVGGFDPALWIGEDWDFINRVRAAGHTVCFDPRFCVRHDSLRTSRAAVAAHARDYGSGYVKLVRQGVVDRSLRTAERWARRPYASFLWAAGGGALQMLGLYARHRFLLRYACVAPVVWYFFFMRHVGMRQELLRGATERICT